MPLVLAQHSLQVLFSAPGEEGALVLGHHCNIATYYSLTGAAAALYVLWVEAGTGQNRVVGGEDWA